MSEMMTLPNEHDGPAEMFRQPAPLGEVAPFRRRTAAEEARTLLSLTNIAALATQSQEGIPWASLVAYGALENGAPVLLVSTLAEHGRNLQRDPRVSFMVSDPEGSGEPLDHGRVTFTGKAVVPTDETVVAAARQAHLAALPSAASYIDFGDFSLWVIEIDRVRWVGGFGRMDSASVADYGVAEPDPVAASAPDAVQHLNEDHAHHMLAIGRTLAGYPDATAVRCLRADRYGLDLSIDTPRGKVWESRVGFEQRCEQPDGLRAAAIELVRRARAA